MHELKLNTVESLKDFYSLMAMTRQVRATAVAAIAKGEHVAPNVAGVLRRALELLEEIPVADGRRILALDDVRTIEIEMEYEVNELHKDLFYLDEGEETFVEMLSDLHPDFDDSVKAGHDLLAGQDFNCLITDRDGTINNYCARYLTSIQSIYNAVFLTRFAMQHVQRPVVLTSAPLDGLIEISVNPTGHIYYAASKGRECLELEGRIRRLPIPEDKQAAMEGLNRELAKLLKQDEYEKFGLIGSGLQFKFGQSTVARQDIGKSIAEEESQAFLAVLKNLIAKLDPKEHYFRIEDTGLDVEIILTIETKDDGLKDFDKGDGVKYLNSELGLEMFRGPHLICGDTGSDVPMLEAALSMAPDTRAIYVTKDQALADRIAALTPNSLILPEPDMLVTVMGTLLPNI